jgi:hypothetical protein
MQHTRIAAVAAVGCVVLIGATAQSGVAASAGTTTYDRITSDIAPKVTLQKRANLSASAKPYALGNGSRSLNTIRKAPAVNRPSVGVVAVSLNWSQLEPTKGAYTMAPLDAQLASAKAMGVTVRLRVIAGTQAPAYVKKLGGAPIPFYDHQAKTSTTIGRFWRTDYQARWQALMTHLAAKYDQGSIIREVNISGTGTISAEPMLTMGRDSLPGSAVTNNDRLRAAGATESARRTALMNDIAFMQKTWNTTHTTLFCHPYVTLDAKPKTSLATTEQIVTTVYNSAPGKTVFGHTGASETTLKGVTHPQALEMYEYFIDHGYPFMAQTQAYSGGAKNEGVGDLGYVMHWLADHGAYSTELPAGWQFDPGALAALGHTTDQMTRNGMLGSGG